MLVLVDMKIFCQLVRRVSKEISKEELLAVINPPPEDTKEAQEAPGESGEQVAGGVQEGQSPEGSAEAAAPEAAEEALVAGEEMAVSAEETPAPAEAEPETSAAESLPKPEPELEPTPAEPAPEG